MLNKRGCGVLLHPTSLPGAGGIGTLGDDARRFVDWLSRSGVTYWQVLPLTPPAYGNSPYSSYSAFAGNPLLIDLEQIYREGDLSREACGGFYPEESVAFADVEVTKGALLRQAAVAFLADTVSGRKGEFWHFCDTTPWLHDYALFMALKRKYKGKPWSKWPRDISLLTKDMFEKASVELGAEIGVQKYIQWQFSRQWKSLKEYSGAHGISLIGDIPIFVAYDSVDVWRNRELFLLDEQGRPFEVAGVPPDYFSKNGQLWGNPLYDWSKHDMQGYSWWIDRFRAMFSCFDAIRIDHFRGFEAAWQVPAGEKTAKNGRWVSGPGERLFDAVLGVLGELPIIAEDLGVITPEVESLRDRYGFPGMKILEFAFGSGANNPYLPHNHRINSIVYTGTHDNDTLVGWQQSLPEHHMEDVLQYLGITSECEITDRLIRTLYMSVANTVILPFQDLLQLDSSGRMNVPGVATGNWGWRFRWEDVPENLPDNMRSMLCRYGRCNIHSIT